MTPNLADPLGLVRAISEIRAQIEEIGLTVHYSSDFEELVEIRRQTRGDRVSPMFDPAICQLDADRAFWLGAFKDDELVSMQAFRLDTVYPNLAEWALGWFAGLYIKRNEIILPAALDPPAHSRTRNLSGRLVYHGEMWIDKAIKKRQVFNLLPRLGLLISHIKWQPDAVWALTGNMFATHGFITRMGYSTQESSFLRWLPRWEPEGADDREWVIIADRSNLEFLVAEDATK
jgi:hypothetical protein